MKCVVSFAAALCLLFFLHGVSSASPFSGLTLNRIEIQDDQGRPWPDPEEITALILVKPGEVFSSENISEGISSLYLTRRFRDIRVEGFQDNGQVNLVYTLVPIAVVDEIKIRGNHSLATSDIRQSLRGVEGGELREDRFPEYRTGISTLYQSEGYYGAGVDFKVKQLKQPYKVALYVYIREPERTIIADVSFSGNTTVTRKQLLRKMKNRPGKPLRTDVLFDEDLAAILQAYYDAGYPAAKAGPVNISFRDRKAFVVISGKEGPKVTVRFSGNRRFSDRELRKQILIWTEHDVSDAIIDSSADKIKNLYKNDGFDSVKVTVDKAETQGNLDLVFNIREGTKVTVHKIEVQGNSHFTTKQVKEDLSFEEPGWFSSSPYRKDDVYKSVDYLRERYLDAGFPSADVKYDVDLIDNGSKAIIRIDINEGPQTTTGAVAFEGNQAVTESELLGRIDLKPGAPYNERFVEEARYRILSLYSEKGYLYARVEAEKKPADGSLDVKYKITEDRQVRIGKIILRGNERTKDEAIKREVLLKPGDPYNYELILKSQQRIYSFGYFNQARFEPVDPGDRGYVKDMLLTVEEGNAGSFEVGVGYGDLDRARAFMEGSYRNVWGLGHYAGLRFEESDILRRAILSYRHPWFFGYDMNGKFALTWSDEKHLNSDTREIYYQTQKTSASYGVEKNIGRLKASLTYAFENVKNYNVEPGAVLSDEDVGYVKVSSLSPSLVWDLRDDIFNPRKGALYGIALKEAMHQLGSEADFTKLSLQSSWYVPLSATVIGALSVRGGMEWPHYTSTEVPIHERFTLGGSTTVRGYEQDTVGSEGTLSTGSDGEIVPTGGTSMALFNMELRFMPTQGFGFVLFSDAGNVWLGQVIKLDDLRASYGAGIRYGTPVGPLRIDYGQKINRRPGESPGELHFNIGHTF